MEQEPSAPRRTQHVTTEDGLELELAESGQGPPVLLLHGFPDSFAMWDGVTEHLVAAGHRVYAIDRKVRDAVEVLNAQGVREPVTVVGHDWGGFVSWALCLSRPDLVSRHVAISFGHPYAMRRASVEQVRKNYYVPAFMLAGVGEWMLSRRDYAVLRHLGRQHPKIDDAVAGLGRPGRLTAALNWYRMNTIPMARRPWDVCRVPTLGVFPADDAFSLSHR